jgi:NAD(P)H dehydrogenase (quinone)
MKKKILVINGHPNSESFNFGIAAAYKAGAEESGAEVRSINIADLNFNPNLQFGYRKRTELEPDLLHAWEQILWADHLVWIHPVWWGGIPAIMKGFIDRLFLPGFCFPIPRAFSLLGQIIEREICPNYHNLRPTGLVLRACLWQT